MTPPCVPAPSRLVLHHPGLNQRLSLAHGFMSPMHRVTYLPPVVCWILLPSPNKGVSCVKKADGAGLVSITYVQRA